MYYENVKDDFYNSLTSDTVKDQFITVRNGVIPFEQKFSKDLGYFTKSEILEYINNVASTRPATVVNYLSVIERYQRFLRADSEQDDIPKIAKEEVDFESALRKKIFLSFSEVINAVSDVVSIYQGSPVPASLAFAWLGVPCKMAIKLKTNHVDVKSGIINAPELGIGPISFGKDEPRALDTLRAYTSMVTAYRNQNPNNRSFEVQFVESDYFLRPIRSENSKKTATKYATSNIKGFISEVQDGLESRGFQKPVTYKNVQFSGELHKAYSLERRGIDFSDKNNESIFLSCFESRSHGYNTAFIYRKYKETFNL